MILPVVMCYKIIVQIIILILQDWLTKSEQKNLIYVTACFFYSSSDVRQQQGKNYLERL